MRYQFDPSKLKEKSKAKSFGKRSVMRVWQVMKKVIGLCILFATLVVVMPSARQYTDLQDQFKNWLYAKFVSADWLVNNIVISGNNKVANQLIQNASNIKIGENIFLISLQNAKQEIEKLPWIKSVTVVRSVPHTIKIVVEEEVPQALFINQSGIWLVNESGKILERVDGDINDEFLKVKGKNANLFYRPILSILHNFKAFKVMEMEFISQRRWNVSLDSGIIIRLPEDQALIYKAFASFSELVKQNKAIENASVVDLRLAPDKIFIVPCKN